MAAGRTIGPMTAGILRGIEDGWFMAEIADAAFVYQQALEKGDKKIVGVNVPHRHGRPRSWRSCGSRTRSSSSSGACSAARRAGRDHGRGRAALDRMVGGRAHRREHDPGDARRGPRRGDARRDLRRAAGEWGIYREPARF